MVSGSNFAGPKPTVIVVRLDGNGNARFGPCVVAVRSQRLLEGALDVCCTVSFDDIPGSFAPGFSFGEQESTLEFL
jgi:hypothetical protein